METGWVVRLSMNFLSKWRNTFVFDAGAFKVFGFFFQLFPVLLDFPFDFEFLLESHPLGCFASAPVRKLHHLYSIYYNILICYKPFIFLYLLYKEKCSKENINKSNLHSESKAKISDVPFICKIPSVPWLFSLNRAQESFFLTIKWLKILVGCPCKARTF